MKVIWDGKDVHAGLAVHDCLGNVHYIYYHKPADPKHDQWFLVRPGTNAMIHSTKSNSEMAHYLTEDKFTPHQSMWPKGND